MLTTILIWVAVALGVGIAVVLVIAFTKPDSFRVERRIAIKAPPEKIFPLINDFHAWPAWSPWEKKDPAMKRTHSGAQSGKGAVYAWEGNKSVGKGSMEIMESSPPSRLLIALSFMMPFEAKNAAEFTLAPSGDTTTVNWAMYGPNLFIGKVMSTFMNMDRMIGKDFEEGLANMKVAAER
ncbi:MAG TPA: SRPBCC family protein [Xanthobacteraceae bacterium]|nr:SRPBCC family protein [Xanthobacteraceae bacterium]